MLEILASLMMIVPTSSFAALSKTEPASKPLEIVFRGIRSDAGKIQIAVFDAREADGFPKAERALKHVTVDNQSRDGVLTVSIPDLPPGDYAFAIFHDEDADGKFKFGFMGIPREGIAFSNNPKIYFGPPSFEKAKVNVGSVETLDIEMKYF